FRSLDTTPAGAEYPNGNETVCAFEGRFTEVEQVDDHEYTMKVKGFIITSQPVASPTSPGRRNPRPQITVDTGINTIYCERDNPPSGFVNTKEFRLYLPGKAVADLPADYVGMAFAAGAPAGEMTFYGLYNAGDQAAFRG
ncbi:MAG: hypothetical protein FWE61_05600, partial [Micrococcales bacterium]|nr:hypothetical protein [Micrococcales bacterium]